MAVLELDQLKAGDRVRVQGGRNFEKFHGGMEATVLENSAENKNMLIQFDDVNTSGPEPMTVSYRHLEAAPEKGGYRPGKAAASSSSSSSAAAAAASSAEAQGPLLDEHGGLRTRQLVELHGLQGAQELNGKLGRLRKFDPNAGRWEVDVREGGAKRLKEENLRSPAPVQVPDGLTVGELKDRGNEHFKLKQLESAISLYSAAIKSLEATPPPPEAEDPKLASILYGNRSQCYINLCREVHGEDSAIGKEARAYAMRANMDSASAIELDPTNGKAYYRRGCAVLGMAPSASRSKEAVYYLETALSGRASGGKDGIVLPNAMREEVTNLLDYAKRRFDACTEMAVPDIEACRENCRQQ